LGEDRTLALVHADGNGLGQLLMDLGKVADRQPQRFIPIFKGFSAAVSRATEQAARRATAAVLKRDPRGGLYPARPIVLGGDDLTMLVRADLALPFAEHFIAAFAEETAEAFERLRQQQDLDLPPRLTACAGIAYARASQPFHMLHHLAEQLCKHAKKKAKATLPPREDWKDKPPSQRPIVPSTLAFHRVTASLVDSWEIVLKDELTLGGLRQTLECYAVDTAAPLPSLHQLVELQRLLANPAMSRGATRELIGMVGNDPLQAPSRYKRWRELMRDGRQHPAHPALFERFQDLLRNLSGSEPQQDLPYGAANEDGLRCSPLGDVEILRSVRNSSDSMMTAERQESE
jgi:succinate dehydrogenase flavin-adding protein (antitoxin of CptAB toxin-antitoxin module)